MPYKDPEKQREHHRKRVAKNRAQAIAERGGHCLNCGSTLNLEFHHRDRKQKENHRIWSWTVERRKAELAKCDLLCRTCHQKETAREKAEERAKHLHGTLASYKSNGCRCENCRTANADYEHSRRLRIMGV